MSLDSSLHQEAARLVGRTGRVAVACDDGPPAGTLVEVLSASLTSAAHVGQHLLPSFRLDLALLTDSGARTDRSVLVEGVGRHYLEPEPGLVDWSRTDSALALAQGWDIFERDCPADDDGTVFELQAWNACARFGDEDSRAWEHVWHRATEEGDPLAQRALAFLYARSPQEYARVRAHCRGVDWGSWERP